MAKHLMLVVSSLIGAAMISSAAVAQDEIDPRQEEYIQQHLTENSAKSIQDVPLTGYKKAGLALTVLALLGTGVYVERIRQTGSRR